MRHLHLSIICSTLYILALSYLPESNIVIPASKHSQPARLSFIHVLLFLSLFISASPLSFVSFLPLKVILFFFFAPIIFSTSHTHPFVIEGVIYCQVYYLVIHYLHFCRLAAYWKFQTKFWFVKMEVLGLNDVIVNVRLSNSSSSTSTDLVQAHFFHQVRWISGLRIFGWATTYQIYY